MIIFWEWQTFQLVIQTPRLTRFFLHFYLHTIQWNDCIFIEYIKIYMATFQKSKKADVEKCPFSNWDECMDFQWWFLWWNYMNDVVVYVVQMNSISNFPSGNNQISKLHTKRFESRANKHMILAWPFLFVKFRKF